MLFIHKSYFGATLALLRGNAVVCRPSSVVRRPPPVVRRPPSVVRRRPSSACRPPPVSHPSMFVFYSRKLGVHAFGTSVRKFARFHPASSETWSGQGFADNSACTLSQPGKLPRRFHLEWVLHIAFVNAHRDHSSERDIGRRPDDGKETKSGRGRHLQNAQWICLFS